MDEKETPKECLNCGYYSPYYTKGYFRFTKTGTGFCMRSRKITEKHGNCENWKNMQYHHSPFNKPSTEIVLNSILVQLAEIKQIMEENAQNEER